MPLLKLNLYGWIGYFLFAAIGTTFFIYSFLPTVGGLQGCLQVTPTFCASMYGAYHVPLGVAGYFVVSHLHRPRTVTIFMLLLLIQVGFCAGINPLHTVRAQPLPLAFVVQDYYPYTFWVDTPANVSYTTTLLDEFYVFEWAYFWPYHPLTIPSTCAPPIPTNDWELVYVYVSLSTQQLAGVAYRFHCSWTFKSPTDQGGLIAVTPPLVYSINATRPVITFVGHYHVPVNGYPTSTQIRTLATQGVTEFQGTFNYQQMDYNYTQVSQLNPASSPIDPAFFRGLIWPNVELLTIVGFIVTGASALIFGFERKKLAGL
jgi:hypothetical protein